MAEEGGGRTCPSKNEESNCLGVLSICPQSKYRFITIQLGLGMVPKGEGVQWAGTSLLASSLGNRRGSGLCGCLKLPGAGASAMVGELGINVGVEGLAMLRSRGLFSEVGVSQLLESERLLCCFLRNFSRLWARMPSAGERRLISETIGSSDGGSVDGTIDL